MPGPRAAAAAALLVVCATAAAQPEVTGGGPRKSVRVVRAEARPVIDGALDEAVWASAALIDDLHQVNPTEFAAPSQPTEILLLYDDDALYVGARLYASSPDEITANVLRQNASITADDSLFVTLDPFNTRRAGYFFGANAHGVRFDGLYRNVSEYYSNWDGIYDVAAGRFDGGWTLEYEIPFRTLSFDPGTDTWGLNFSRAIAQNNEDIAWVSRNRRWDPSVSGVATGFEGLKQGLGLDVTPSASLQHRREFGPRSDDSDFEPSLDIAYKLTPQMNMLATVNTDFSATEVDDRQVNLTRFNLFFPEKRDFFLREADIFEFGRIGAQSQQFGIGAPDRQNGRPFFSRRIGLSAAGEVVDLDYGAKVSGRAGRWELGALSIREAAHDGVDAGWLSVVRAKANVLEESTAGVIVTNGDPLSNASNTLMGADFLYRNTRLPGGRTLEAEAWYQQSDTEGISDAQSAAGIGLQVPSNQGVRGGLTAKQFERNFRPALGFLSRPDVRAYTGYLGYMHRPPAGRWQSMLFGVDYQRYELIDGGLQSEEIGINAFEMTTRRGDTLFWRTNIQTEVLQAPFEIYPGVVIPVGEYEFGDNGIELRTAGYRRVSGRITYLDGDFYGGTRKRAFGNVSFRPSPRFSASLGYDYNDIDLPQGAFVTRLATAGIDVVFSSTLSWVNLIQYDNVSETMGVNMRLHWIPQAGREIYFIVNQNLEDFDRDNRFDSLSVDATVRASYTFRF